MTAEPPETSLLQPKTFLFSTPTENNGDHIFFVLLLLVLLRFFNQIWKTRSSRNEEILLFKISNHWEILLLYWQGQKQTLHRRQLFKNLVQQLL